jgi:uncharacterized membrane protein
MNPHDPETVDARLERLERLVADLQRQLAERPAAPAFQAAQAVAPAPPMPFPAPASPVPPRVAPRDRAPGWRMNWDGQLWLNRLGIGMVLLGVALLFRYSIDQGWLTPAVRVGFGAAAGAALFGAGLRLDQRRGFGAVLAGGGIAAWYITGWAAFHLYGLIGYLPAFAGMVAITALAFGMALVRGSPILAVLGALGGLGTPLILGVTYGSPRGFALYTSLVLAWTTAVYLRRGWRPVLWTTLSLAWVLLWVYARHLPSGPALRAADPWIVQAAILFAWISLGALPLAKRVVDFRRVSHGHERHWKHAEVAHWYALALIPPHAALLSSAAVWHPQPEVWGWWVIGAAGVYAIAAWTLHRPDPRIARAVLFTASLLLSVGSVAALEADALIAVFALHALALHVVSTRGGGVPARWMAHKVFILAAGWMLVRLFDSAPTAARSLADLAVLAVGLASAFLVRTPRSRLWYLYFVHVGLLGWLWRELAPFEGGQGYATIAWCAYGLGLMMLARRRGWPLLERTAIATLMLVVAKLFLVDLAALHALFRVALFLGFGSVFLVLSYALQSWWKTTRPEPSDSAPRAPSLR